MPVITNQSGILGPGWGKAYNDASFPRAAGGSASRLPAVDFITLRFDFSNISTLWQDTSRTIPVTAVDDPVRGMTNLGSRAALGEHLSNLLAARSPLWKPDQGACLFTLDDVLENTGLTQGLSNGRVSFAMLGLEHSGADGLSVTWENGTFSSHGNIITVAAGAITRYEANVGVAYDVDPDFPDPANKLSFIGYEGPSTSRCWLNHEAGFRDRSSVANSTNVVSDFRIGANSGTGSSGWNGYFRELVIWEDYLLTDEDSAQIRQYDNQKHGTAWV